MRQTKLQESSTPWHPAPTAPRKEKSELGETQGLQRCPGSDLFQLGFGGFGSSVRLLQPEKTLCPGKGSLSEAAGLGRRCLGVPDALQALLLRLVSGSLQILKRGFVAFLALYATVGASHEQALPESPSLEAGQFFVHLTCRTSPRLGCKNPSLRCPDIGRSK